jgi:23S rRNA (cytosine1962-C5)-methyltransferase
MITFERGGSRPVWIGPSQFAAFADADTDAHRLYSDSEGFAERLGNDALLCFRSGRARDEMLAGLTDLPWEPARVFGKSLALDDDRSSPFLLRGDASLPMQSVVREGGIRYGLDFDAGPSHGLFLDQRANRALLRRTPPKRLLNTFAYTCSFSVVAALGGAQTVSVELSKKSVQRGRENFALNDIEIPPNHRLFADDVLDVMPRLVRRGEKFDAIILDPPTFSRGNKGRVWKVEEHFGGLLASALELATPGARILLSTNCTRWDAAILEEITLDRLQTSRRRGSLHQEPALPDFPDGHGATTLWLTLR